MCGAGTTCKMAKATGRRWIGVDVSADYSVIARCRVDAAETDSVSPPPPRPDPFDEPLPVCRWCSNEIPAARLTATGGRAVTCSPECSDFNGRRRRSELKAEDRARRRRPRASPRA